MACCKGCHWGIEELAKGFVEAVGQGQVKEVFHKHQKDKVKAQEQLKAWERMHVHIQEQGKRPGMTKVREKELCKDRRRPWWGKHSWICSDCVLQSCGNQHRSFLD